MTDCNKTLVELQLFLDGELPATERAHVMEHLDECLECLHTYDFQAQLREIIATKCRSDVMPADLMDRIKLCMNEAAQSAADAVD